MYLSSLEEKLMNIKISQKKYSSLTKEERSAVYNLKNDKNIVIKNADKVSAVVIWDRDDYIKEDEKQLGDLFNGPGSLISTIHAIEKNSENRRSESRYN